MVESSDRSFAENERRAKLVKQLKKDIVLGLFSLVPFSLILQDLHHYQPILLLNILRMLRLLKIWPLFAMTNLLKKLSLNPVRIIEVLITYYIVNHIVACLYISIAINSQDVSETWLRRYPVPDVNKFKTLNSDHYNSVYIHAIYFSVNTISHVAIGDITMVTPNERALNAFTILCGTFIYSFLFGNIASMVADFAPKTFIQFRQRYDNVMRQIESEQLPH